MEEKQKKISLLQIGCTSEWALAKLFPILFNGISTHYNLIGICGRESTTNGIIDRFTRERTIREGYKSRGEDRIAINNAAELKSIETILENLQNGRLKYYQATNSTPNSVHLPETDYSAVAIFTSNITHLNYIEEAIKQRKHIVCEKPLVVVTDTNHRADRTQLTRLEQMVDSADEDLILMDSEHYSSKPATLAFYEHFQDMLEQYGKISRIQGGSMEVDDPEKTRTRNLLRKDNCTGLLLDVGVHYFGIISNIDGEVKDILDSKYDSFRDNKTQYNVETYAHNSFTLAGQAFHENATGEFTFAKFIDRFKKENTENQPLRNQDEKKYHVTFEKRNEQGQVIDSTTVTIDFNNKSVTDSKGVDWTKKSKQYSKDEYHNILSEFYDCIENHRQPRTNFRNSIKTLDAIYRIHEKFPVFNQENQAEVYRR